ncbi:hypothetical protein Tco_0802909 [Tanacetum coccineum]|uniref:Uncharacterized protein n=1 Tax=Tanacetum coccineum TaxID=301880 RepID=A0ABQ5A2U3_9ASTR
MPESSQQHIKIERICFDCGDLLHGLNCLECDLTRKILEKAFQKFQNTSKSSNDNSNVVNAPREPFVVKQDPSVNSSQKSPLIDQKCCCECGDSLDGIFCQRCTFFNNNSFVVTIVEVLNEDFSVSTNDEDYYKEQNLCYDSNSFGLDQFTSPYTVYHQILKSQNEFFNSQNEQFKSRCEHLNTQMTTLHDLIAQAMQKKEEEKRIAEEQAAKERYWKIPICDDDDDYTIAITPVFQPKEPWGGGGGYSKVCDVPVHDNSPPLDISKDQSEDFSDSNVDSTSTDEDSFSSNDIEYVEASPPNSEPVSSKVMGGMLFRS